MVNFQGGGGGGACIFREKVVKIQGGTYFMGWGFLRSFFTFCICEADILLPQTYRMLTHSHSATSLYN